MFDLITRATLLVTAVGAIYAYRRVHDALHPAVVVAPVTGYVYGLWPILINSDGALEQLFAPGQLDFVASLYLCSVLSFYVGMCRFPKSALSALRAPVSQNVFSLRVRSFSRRRLYALSIILGMISLAAYFHMIDNAGGFIAAYSRYKGGGWTSSGYIGEAVLLSFPAVMLLALSIQGSKRLGAGDILVAVVISLPHLIQGTLGGRRGPLFLVLLVLFVGWYVARGKRPSFKNIIIGISVIGFSVVVLQSQRRYLYLGSEGQFEVERVANLIRAKEQLQANDYVTGVSTVLTADYFEDFYWGKRYLVIILVRPIPKQIWPTKYEDVGADWLTAYDPNEGGSEMLQAVGFLPAVGSAPGFVADIYQEFAWGVVVVVYLFGRVLGGMWLRHRVYGGLWTVIYAEAMILCVYLPTQSFSAWFHRFLFMSVISVMVWRYWVGNALPPKRLSRGVVTQQPRSLIK